MALKRKFADDCNFNRDHMPMNAIRCTCRVRDQKLYDDDRKPVYHATHADDPKYSYNAT